jgi:hypothetical protein
MMNTIHHPQEDGISIGSGSDGFSMSSSRLPGGAGAGDESQLMGSSADGSRTDDASKNKGTTIAASAPLVHHETTKLLRARMIMVLVLLISTFATAWSCHHFVKRVEHDDFENRVRLYIQVSQQGQQQECLFPYENSTLTRPFHNICSVFTTIPKYIDFANQIIAVSQLNAVHIFELYASMSLQMTAYALSTGAQWPNVIFPEFDRMAKHAISLTGAEVVGYGPLVKHRDRQDYEEYVFQNQDWIPAALSDTNLSALVHNISMPPEIIAFNETGYPIRESKHPMYVPLVQISPLESAGVSLNYNGFDYPFFRRVFEGMVVAKRAVLSEVNNLLYDPSLSNHTIDDDEFQEELLWPSSFMASPVYNRLGGGAEIAGILFAYMPWHSYFQNVLPEGIDGILVVVKNTCTQTFSYRIDGPEVTYLGPEDRHDPSHDRFEVDASFTAFTSIAECIYSFHVYPTEELIDTYKTNRPVTFTIAIVLVFLEVTVVFMVYDMLVERRQKKVMSSALRSGAIVNR